MMLNGMALARFRAFLDDTRGSLSVETALVMPLLTWLYVGSFVWFDAFRVQNANLKAAYTISDMVSRTDQVDTAYMGGLNVVLDYLTPSNHPTYIRVTLIQCKDQCDNDSRTLEVDWSYATTGRSPITTAGLPAHYDKIPYIADEDRIIMVETFMAYEPIFNVGIGSHSFENYILTRPRFTSKICYDEIVDCGTM